MSLSAVQSLFFKDYTIRTLELKGDYEIWTHDIEEYFIVSGLPNYYTSIVAYTEPDVNHDIRPGEEEIDKVTRKNQLMLQARYIIYRSLGDSIKREIAKERYLTDNVLNLWRAVRSCFYLQDESTVQQLRDDIAQLDVEKAGSWSSFCDQLERLYTRLDVVAGEERTFHATDKLYKLRTVLSKLDGEKERNIYNQLELLVDQSEKEVPDLYNQCWRFVDKRMKLIDKPITTKQAAYQTVSKVPTCNYCKKPGHSVNECRKPKIKPICRGWDPKTKVCQYEKRTSRKCSFRHNDGSVSSVEEGEENDIVWMFTNSTLRKPPREQSVKNVINHQVFKTMTSKANISYANQWVLDGAATINLSNGEGHIPGTKRSKETIIEVVGRSKIICSEVANFNIPIFLPNGSRGKDIFLQDVPILKILKYNLISEGHFTKDSFSVIKTGKNCWIMNPTNEVLCVGHTATVPSLCFLGTNPEIAKKVGDCPWSSALQVNIAECLKTETKAALVDVDVDGKESPENLRQVKSLPTSRSEIWQNLCLEENQSAFFADGSALDEAHWLKIGTEKQWTTSAQASTAQPSHGPLVCTTCDSQSSGENNNFCLHTHTFTNNTTNELSLWHQRLGHLNFDSVCRILNLPQPKKAIFCPSCCQGKSTLLPAPKEKATRSTRIAQLLHSDMAGPMEVPTPSGKKYILIFVDDCSRRIFLYLLRTKDEFFKEFQSLDNVIEVETTKRVAFLRSDSDGAYTSGELDDYCRKRGIQRQFSTAYNQFQNGVSERTIRTLVEMMRTMIIHAGAPKNMWGEAVCYAVQIMNRKPTKAVSGYPNPISAWRDLKLAQVHLSLRVWGCKVMFYDHRPEVKKLDPKTIDGIFVGIDTERKAWRILVAGHIVCRRDVTFIEDIFPFRSKGPQQSVISIGDEFASELGRSYPVEGVFYNLIHFLLLIQACQLITPMRKSATNHDVPLPDHGNHRQLSYRIMLTPLKKFRPAKHL
jgi:hypothetical protein